MNAVKNSLLLRTLMRQPVPRTPVWIMRQAGRYLLEYRRVRSQAGSFMNLCRTAELACEVTLQPLRRFALDAAIVFSDILTIPDAMGLGLYFTEGEGPAFQHPLRTSEAIDRLPCLDVPDALSYVLEAVSLIRREMPGNLPLIGFSGSPWTLACYMVEGRGSRDFKTLFTWLQSDPALIAVLLQKLTVAVGDYLLAQIQAGADVVMLFDTWGGLLSTAEFQHHSLAYMTQIVQQIKECFPQTPVILFTKGSRDWLSSMADSGCDALGVDWACDLRIARQQVGSKVALQGNLDPAVLLEKPSVIRQKVQEVLISYGVGGGHIFNLGHGITPEVPPEHVTVLLDAVAELSPAFHRILSD